MKWFEKANFYQFYPLSYSHGEYGLSELELWSDHLKSLNVNAIYLSPLFESISHGYDTTDYYQVDSRIGDNNTLINLVNHYHSSEIKVVLDCVFNHVGRDFFAFKDLLKNRNNSRYVNWFKNVDFTSNNCFNDSLCYDCWEGVESLVLLNHDCVEVKQYLLDVVKYWIDTFHIDGLRFDVAYSLPLDFVESINRLTKTYSENFFLLGEVIHGDYSKYVSSTLFDSVTDYELHQSLYNSHKSKNYFELSHTLKRQFIDGVGNKLYNFVDNHDVDRLASKIGNKEDLFLAYAIIYTLSGIVSLYNGDEWGAEGIKIDSDDSQLRSSFNINELILNNEELLVMIRNLSKLRNDYCDILHKGGIKDIYLENEYYVFERFFENKSIRVYLNQSDNLHNFEGDFTKLLEGRNYSLNKNNNYLLPHGFLIVLV